MPREEESRTWAPFPPVISDEEINALLGAPPYDPNAPTGGVLEKARRVRKQRARPDPQYWMKHVQNFFGKDVESMKAFLESGQSLTEYAQGLRFGPETAKSFGLQFGVGYTEEQLGPWLDVLHRYGTAYHSSPLGSAMRQLPYWSRGAQLGFSPEEYVNMSRQINEQGAEWARQVEAWKQMFPKTTLEMGDTVLTRSEAEEWFAGQFPAPPRPQLSKLDQYLFGFSNEAPPGFVSLQRAGIPPLGAGGAEPPRQKPKQQQQQALDWFREQYPTISKDLEPEKPKMPSGRFAPRVTTLRF